jgi:hypothetical protein
MNRERDQQCSDCQQRLNDQSAEIERLRCLLKDYQETPKFWRAPVSWSLSNTRELIMRCLLSRPRAWSKLEIHQYLYGLRPNGGPNLNNVDVQMVHIRRLLRPRGWRSPLTRHGIGYEICPDEREAMLAGAARPDSWVAPKVAP